jgi:hypothetical protein
MQTELATMIPEQLDLFGGSLRPPQKIREEELLPAEPLPGDEPTPAMNEALPEWVAEANDIIEVEEPLTESVLEPVSDVIAWMEPGDHEPTPVSPEPLIAPADSVVIELPAQQPPAQAAEDETAVVPMTQLADVSNAATMNEEPGMQQLNIPPDEILFKRQYYSMRETATMFDITHSMLRYWENEFDINL